MTEEPYLPLGHTSTPAASPSNPLLFVVSGVLSFLLWLSVIGQLVFMVPRFERVFGEFRMKMSLMMVLTEWVIRDSRWAVPAITIGTLLVGIGLGRRSPWPWLFLLFLLPLVINVLVGVSLFYLHMELLEGLEGGKK
jgi:hypothetical protein